MAAGDIILAAEDKSGEWGTVQFELPDAVETLRDNINNVAELLIAVLDIALTALQLVKAFAFAFIDPLAAIVQALVDAINGFLEDFRQLGIYITGDWALLRDDYEDLRGGFSEYERRMIARLADRTDPTRPDVSSSTTVLAAFFYLSVDYSEIERLVAFVKQLLKLFNQSFFATGSPPVPVITGVKFGSETTGVFGSLENVIRFDRTPPQKAKVTWKASPVTTRHPFNPFPPIGPGGFLITVSTLPDPISVAFSRPVNDTQKDGGQQPREYGLVRDVNGAPVLLHGGADMLSDVDAVGYNQAVTLGKLKDGVPQVFGLRSPADNGVIPLESLKDGDTYYFQRTFKVGLGSVALQWATQEFSTVLNLEDMPHHAEVTVGSDGKMSIKDLGKASTYYVRVASASAEVGGGEKNYAFDFSTGTLSGNLAGQPFIVNVTDGLSPEVISAFSTPAKVAFPNTHTAEFLDALTAALAILVLSRSDLPTLDVVQESKGATAATEIEAGKSPASRVALVRTGLEKFRPLLDTLYPGGFAKELEERGINPVFFRADLLRRCRRLAKDITDRLGARPDLQEVVVRNTQNLITADWQTILEGIGEGAAANALGSVPFLSALDTEMDPSEFEGLRALIKERTEEEARSGATDAFGQQLQPLDIEIPSVPVGGRKYVGVAPNPYSIGVPDEAVDNLLMNPQVTRHRKPAFAEYAVDPGTTFSPQVRIPKDQIETELAQVAPGLREVYERHIRAEEGGDIILPTQMAELLGELKGRQRMRGSMDLAPVFYLGSDWLLNLKDFSAGEVVSLPHDEGIIFIRSALQEYQDGVLYQEAGIALGIAASVAIRPPQDGEWIAIRFFDMLPGLENFFESIQNWMDSVSAAIRSVADTILAYINFVEARLVELQQLIRRINAMIQSILGFSVNIPQCSALMLIANGTDGVLSGLVTADNKPSDSPLAYGAGVAVLAPTAPSFLIDLFKPSEGDPDPGAVIATTNPADAFGLPAENLEAPVAEPDVL